MTELELRRNGSIHIIRVKDGESLAEVAEMLDQWERKWQRAKRKASA
jgi:hypothetical protein